MSEASAVLVTGAQGLLGRHLVDQALARWPQARVFGVGRSPRRDDLFTHSLSWLGEPVPAPVPDWLRQPLLDARYTYLTQDLQDGPGVAELLRHAEPDVVVHAAAALRDESWDRLFAANVAATVSLVTQLAAASRPVHLVLVSSGSVYGVDDGPPPFHETASCRPMDLYGVSKRAAEDAVRVLAGNARLPVTIARVFNLVGPALQERHLPAALASQVAAIVAQRQPPVVRVGPLDASRDFVDVRDAAGTCLDLAGNDAGVYNVGSGIETPVRHVLDVMIDSAGLRDLVRVEQAPATRPADLPRSFADTTRVRGLVGLRGRDLGATLSGMVEYYLTSYTGRDRTSTTTSRTGSVPRLASP